MATRQVYAKVSTCFAPPLPLATLSYERLDLFRSNDLIGPAMENKDLCFDATWLGRFHITQTSMKAYNPPKIGALPC